jgi:phage recombination protein Bet
MNVVSVRQTMGPTSLQWWNDARSVALVKRTAAKDCNEDEFNQFVSVCRDLGLSPLRKQIYAFVFNKDKPANRNMALVVGIDGGRSIAARSGNYRPDDNPPDWEISDEAKNALTNPHGIISCTVGVYHRPTRTDPFERIVAKVFWDEFAPILRLADADAYEWVKTGEMYPRGHAKAGQEKVQKQLRPGASAIVTERLDPKKEQWIRGGRHKIALCAEMQALRRGWPEDMSRLYVEEETDRANAVIDGEYTDLTPAEMVVKADTDARMERIGGPALFAIFDDAGTLERIPVGQFADRVDAHTQYLGGPAVALWTERNRAAMNEFWAHNKTDALALKKLLEQRSGVVASAAASDEGTRAKAAPPQHGDTNLGGAAQPAKPVAGALTGQEAFKLKARLLADIRQLTTVSDFIAWPKGARVHIDRLPADMQAEIDTEFQRCQGHIAGKN